MPQHLALPQFPQKLSSTLMNNVPTILRPALKMVPHRLQQAALLPVLHSIFAEAIEDGDFEFLQDKWLKISIVDLDLQWLLSFNGEQLIMAPEQSVKKEDVSFSATGDDLVLIAGRKEDPDTLFFQRRLKIEGDTELGLEVKNLIDAIDLEQLPSLFHKGVALCANIIATQKKAKTE